jgi:rSAM/selenodomain-associated transferase 1
VAYSVTLALFARYPRLGEVKSRLAARIGPADALQIYRALLSDSLFRFGCLPANPKVLYLTGCSREEAEGFLSAERNAGGFEGGLQGEGDLGSRMRAVADFALRNSAGIVFLGSDSPTVPLAYLRRAIGEVAAGTPVVLGPSCDGGYFLLGLSQPRPELFSGIDWGSGRVLRQTLDRVPNEEVVQLPYWYDIDHEEDLAVLCRDLARSPAAGFPELRSLMVDGEVLSTAKLYAPKRI